VKRPCPVTPDGTVRRPNVALFAAALAFRIPFTATATVTVLAPAVLLIHRSSTVPAVAPRAAPRRVPVGSVIVVAASEVDVMKPVNTCASVAVAVELIAVGVFLRIGPTFIIVHAGTAVVPVFWYVPTTAPAII